MRGHRSGVAARVAVAVVALFVVGLAAACAPPPAPRLAQIAVGGTNTCARFDDGSVRCWGSNSLKQLGVDQSVRDFATTPVAVPLPDPVSDLALGNGFGCAVTTAGGADCWGKNLWGALGNGTYDGLAGTGQLPGAVVGLPGPVTQVSAGVQHTCARTAAGTATCWGDNGSRQLGDVGNPYPSFRLTPFPVAALDAVQRLELGGSTSCALRDGGSVWCWGSNTAGKVDAADTNGVIGAPRQVAGLSSGATSVANGSFSSVCAVKGGRVLCWGNNIGGVLGTGVDYPTLAKSLPVEVAGITDAVSVVGGYQHHCALLADTTVRCWGRGDLGQLGDGTFRPWVDGSSGSATPVTVSGLSGVVELVSGSDASHTCAVLADRSVRCWGSNAHGELGDGTRTNSAVPVTVTGLT